MRILSILIFGVFFLLSSCKQEVETCEPLRSDLIAFNVAEVKGELDVWLGELPPDAEDPDIHLENLQAFTLRLKNDCMLNAGIVCFACIETYPPQSEIRIMLDSAGHQVQRVVDVLTPSDTVMKISNIHL